MNQATINPLTINDPVYGFIQIPRGILTDIINHPLFQRLGRIQQLGLSALVYPGAQHTRKQHCIGAFHLMTEALKSLSEKGLFIFEVEKEAAQAAILLHDVGHAPFSHVLERVLTPHISHEEISLLFMEQINHSMKGALNMAIKIFKNEYEKTYLHQLICSQLDMDRLDYLCRDSFFTGVREGNIGSARIIKMLNVIEDGLVVDEKGLYSVENYLMSRRLMYWQVYLHKTALAAEEMLCGALERAKKLVMEGRHFFASPPLAFFLSNNEAEFQEDWLKHYADLDDSDIISALKQWQYADDKILSVLANSFINRRLFKVISPKKEDVEEFISQKKQEIAKYLGITYEETEYFVKIKTVCKDMYSSEAEGIKLLCRDNSLKEISEVSQLVHSNSSSECDRKTYIFYYPTQ